MAGTRPAGGRRQPAEGRRQAADGRRPSADGRRDASSPRWLLLVHQLPASPSNLRVRTWRRLQQLGAVAVKQAAYALPDTAASREDFEWLRIEIVEAGGEASVFAAEAIDGVSDHALVEEFRSARDAEYLALAKVVERHTRERVRRRSRPSRGSPRDLQKAETLRRRFAAIERIDFFNSPGRARVVDALAALEEPAGGADAQDRRDGAAAAAAGAYQGRLWVTRPRPGVDRMASAWLIRRFIDAGARFDFVTDPRAAPAHAVPFDMFGVEFSHHGADCTFETLCTRFGIADAAVGRLAAIVHDLDLKDDRFGAPEAATVALAIDGLQMAHADDQALLEQGMTLFEALYRSFARASRPSRRR